MKPPVIVISRSHQDSELMDYLTQMGEHTTVEIGSSLKFCLVAEGKAQLYPRFSTQPIFGILRQVMLWLLVRVRKWLIGMGKYWITRQGNHF